MKYSPSYLFCLKSLLISELVTLPTKNLPYKFFFRTKETSNKYIKQFLISKENYFLALADHIIELQMFTIEHALDYSYYLLDILMLNETVNASTLLFLEKVYEKLSGLGAFRSLVMFSVFIFPR